MELIDFDFNGTLISATTINGEPWFIAKNVCLALEISDVSQACSRLDDDEKLMRTLYVSGQNRESLLINESGLYSLILTSRKPEAKAFKKWVTSEVLPSIRKTGSYQVKPKSALELAREQVALLETIEQQSKLIEQQKPAVEFVDRFVSIKSSKSITEVAKILGVGQREFFEWLAEKKIIYKRSDNWLPASTYAKYFDVKIKQVSETKEVSQSRFVPAGIVWVAGKWTKEKTQLSLGL